MSKHSNNVYYLNPSELRILDAWLSSGLMSVSEARQRLGWGHSRVFEVLDPDMKHTIKNLERVLKEAFDESLVITLFNKVDKIVHLMWIPDNGPTEYGQYAHYDASKNTTATRNSFPTSADAWTKIFRVIELFFSESDAALYLIRYTEWDGTIEHLFESYKTIRVRYDPIENQWSASMDNVHDVGPPLHIRNNSDLLIAMCEAVTDVLLFSEYRNERKEIETEWNDLTNFHEWKKYKISA